MSYTNSEIAIMFTDEDPELTVIKEGNWVDEGKRSFRTSIVTIDNKFYQIEESRSDSYYTDYYYDDPEVYEVVPKEVVITQTIYEKVKK